MEYWRDFLSLDFQWKPPDVQTRHTSTSLWGGCFESIVQQLLCVKNYLEIFLWTNIILVIFLQIYTDSPPPKKKSSKRIFVSWFYNTEEESNIFGILPRPYYFFFNYTDTHRKNTGPYFYVKFIKKKNWFIFVTNCDRQWKYKDHT